MDPLQQVSLKSILSEPSCIMKSERWNEERKEITLKFKKFVTI